MRMDEYADHDATGLADLVRRREVTPDELYALAIEAINAVNVQLNAVADGPWERPLDYNLKGPFAGVPFAIKDLGVHAQGVPARFGTRLSGKGIVFNHDSFVIRRFREAGFAAAALTTAPEFGFNANSEALVYGSTRNPWNLSRSAGGSSGGAGSLAGAAAVPVAHANDGGGSTRIPAAYNGLVGLKPSRERVSPGPDIQESLAGLGAEFAVTHTMRDCAGVLDAIAGAMPGDKCVIKEPARPWSQELGVDPGSLRVALLTDSWSPAPVDPEVVAAINEVARQLEACGHHVEHAAPSFDWEEFIAAMVPIMAMQCVEAVAGISAATGNQPSQENLEHTGWACYQRGLATTALEVARALLTVNKFARGAGQFFTEWDLLVTPTTNTAAPPLGHHNADDSSMDFEGWARHVFELCSFTPQFNWTGTPAISLPLGSTSDGLPIGVQLAAPMCEEARLIQVGSQLETAMPWKGRRPAVHAANCSASTT